MPSTPTTPSNPKPSKTAASSSPSAPLATPAKPAVKKGAAKAADGEGTLVDKSIQKTTRKAVPKARAGAKNTFEKPAEAEWHRMISEAAYYRAERRGFQAGYEHEDWVWAEEEVRKILSP